MDVSLYAYIIQRSFVKSAVWKDIHQHWLTISQYISTLIRYTTFAVKFLWSSHLRWSKTFWCWGHEARAVMKICIVSERLVVDGDSPGDICCETVMGESWLGQQVVILTHSTTYSVTIKKIYVWYIDRLVQERHNSSALALEFLH